MAKPRASCAPPSTSVRARRLAALVGAGKLRLVDGEDSRAERRLEIVDLEATPMVAGAARQLSQER
jgi:hypothetical protein